MKKLGKIASIAGSLLMGASLIAAAVPYTDGSANVAVIYGSRGAELTDQTAATNLRDAAQTALDVSDKTVTSVTGGEKGRLDKDSDEFQFGYTLNQVVDELDKNDMKVFLADGEYDDGSIDEEYSQTITLGSNALELFADSDYKDEEPTIGFRFDDDVVLSYTLTFDDAISYNGTEGTNIPIAGEEYYVLDASDESELILLDTADSNEVSEGSEPITVNGKSVEISVITEDYVVFKVDGETTDKLYEDADDGDKYFELDDESYIVLKSNWYSPKDSGVSKAEFSLGSGKITLPADGTVEVNDETIEGLTSTVATATDNELTNITLEWATDGEVFLVEGGVINMPVFETISLAFNGISFPSDSEKISLDAGDALKLNMGNFDVELAYSEDNSTVTQGDDGKVLVIDATEANNKTYYLPKNGRFIATYLDQDLSDVEQLYYEVTSMNDDSSGIDLKLTDKGDTGKDITFTDADEGDDDSSRRDITVTVENVYEKDFEYNDSLTDDVFESIPETYWNITLGSDSESLDNEDILLQDIAVITVDNEESGNLHFDKVVSETGMVVEIPTITTGIDTEAVKFYEVDEDGKVDTTLSSASIEVTLAWDDDEDEIYATKDGVTFQEVSKDSYVGYVESIRASKVEVNTDSNTYEITSYGDNVVADVEVIGGGQTSAGEAGAMLIMDTEAGSYANANWIVVGGNCVNTVAADLLETSTTGSCLEAFEAKTGAGAGQYLLEEVTRDNGKKALIVAGYAAADTTKAANAVLGSYTLGVNPSA